MISDDALSNPDRLARADDQSLLLIAYGACDATIKYGGRWAAVLMCERCAILRGADLADEALHLDFEPGAFLRQRLRCREHLRGRRASFAVAAADVVDVDGDLRAKLGGLTHVARDFLRRGTLILDGSGDGRRDFRDLVDRR